ncbi:MAG TPA: sialidase family protein, partial [Acidobacteriaceae bacterium]
MKLVGIAYAGLLLMAVAPLCAPAQQSATTDLPAYRLRAQRFLAGRSGAGGTSAAQALSNARAQHLQMTQDQASSSASPRMRSGEAAQPRAVGLGAAWTAVGPAQVASQSFGDVTGRVTSIAIDPADATGNTVYLGTTGAGVWKSTNAAGAAANVTFAPLTDTLPVFSPNSGTPVVPSLSIGAVTVGQYAGANIVLTGTGDPNDATDSYYGEGILRSVDGGTTWSLAQQSNDGVSGLHSFVGLGVAGFAWSTATPGVVVAALSQSAEGTVVNAPDATYSTMGLYYSTDAGATWKMATIQDGTQVVQRPVSGGAPGNAVTAVAWNTVRQRFYAAVRFHGYYESADGVTWTRLPNQPGTGLTLGVCPTNFGSSGSVNCPIFRGALAVQPITGDTFALTADINNLDQGLWQDVCAVSGGSCATNEIAFGTRLNSAPLEVGSGSTKIPQADYDLALHAVASGGDTLLFAGTVDLYRCSLAAGCLLRNTTNAENGCAAPAMVSPAQHTIAALAGAGTVGLPLIFVGNDGGLWRSTDGVDQQQAPCSTDDKTHFDNLNAGLGSLAEVASFAEDPTDAATLIAGLGTNGTAATSSARSAGAGAAAWPQIAAGEGGAVAIDPANPLNWYVSVAAGVNLRYCGKGSACSAADFAGAPTIGFAQVANDDALIDAPVLLDPQLTTSALIGTCRVWRGPAESGATWPGANEVSAELGSGANGVCGVSNAYVRSLAAGGPASAAAAVQDAGSTVLYAGMAGAQDGGAAYAGHLFVDRTAGTASANTSWADAALSTVTNDAANAGVFNPGAFDISSVTADPHDATGMTVYATVMGFGVGGANVPHLYRSTNGGASWANITANLPNAPANAVIADPNDANTVYVATDTGVYATGAVTSCVTAACWGVMGTSLPNAPAVGLAASAAMATGDGRSGELRVSTYGRGIWEIPLLTAQGPAAAAITLNPASLTFAAQPIGTASAALTIVV